MCRSNNLLSDFVRYVDCNISNISPILKGLLSLARRVEITTDPDQEAVPACDLLRGNATCDVDIVITPPRVLIGPLHCVDIVILPLPLVLIYCMNIGNLCSYIYILRATPTFDVILRSGPTQ